MPPERLRAAAEIWKRERPKAVLRSLSGVYNCVGMIYASRRTSIDIDDLQMILDEDGYRQIQAKDLQPGDVAVYQRRGVRTHVALVLKVERDFLRASSNVSALSQWGFDGEYLHTLSHVPTMYGQPTEFWTDRTVR